MKDGSISWYQPVPGDQVLQDKEGTDLILLITYSEQSFRAYPGLDADDYVNWIYERRYQYDPGAIARAEDARVGKPNVTVCIGPEVKIQ